MGSRVRSDPSNLFEVFFELAKPISENEEPYILQQFPVDYNDQMFIAAESPLQFILSDVSCQFSLLYRYFHATKEILRSVPKFAFPYAAYQASQPAEHFAFVLTDLESKFKFGFCRLSAQSSTHTCLCIVSSLPWFEVFYSLLDHLAKILNDPTDRPVCLLLDLLFNHQDFKSGDHVSVATVSQNETDAEVCRPKFETLHLLQTCLTYCIEHIDILQHLYIPVLPPHLLEYCSAPMPFLIGVHTSVMQKVRKQDLGDAVILDVDTNSITSEYNDLEILPEDVVASLKRHVKQCVADSKTSSGRVVVGDGISRAFMTSLVALIGGYRDALRFRPGEQITFDPDAFVLSRPPNMQPFLNKALQLQTFQQFVADRLDMLNSGLGFSDEFDVQVNLYGDKWGTQSRYKDWLNHMKIQSKKLKREGRDKWLEFSGKVKAKSKKTLKDFRLRIDDSRKDGVSPTFHVHPPAITHVDPAKRPPRPPPPVRQYVPTVAPRHSVLADRTQHYHVIDVADGADSINANPSSSSAGGTMPRRGGSFDRQSVDDSAVLESSLRPSDMDLLSDPDILNAFKKSYSMEDLAITADSSSTATDSESDMSVTWIDQSVSVSYKHNSLSPGVRLSDAAVAPNFSAKSNLQSISRNSSSSSGVAEGSQAIPRPAPRQTIANQSGPLQGVELAVPSAVDTATDHNSLLIVLDDSPTGSTNLACPFNGNNMGSVLPESSSYSPVPKPRLSKQSAQISDIANIGAQWLTAGEIVKSNSVSSQSSPSFPLNRSVPNLQPGGVPSNLQGPTSSASNRPQVNNARAMFMQSSVPPITTISPRQSSLEQFDPLSSGQLAVDYSQLSNQAPPGDEDLLKEWNLDFTPLYQSSTATGGPVRTQSGMPRSALNIPAPASGFVSMPNLAHPAVGIPGRYPGYGYGPPTRTPWTMNRPMMSPSLAMTRAPALPHSFLMPSRAPADSLIKSSTLPPGLNPTCTYPVSTSGIDVAESGDLVDLLMVNNVNSVRTEHGLVRPASINVRSLSQVPAVDKSSTRWEKFE